MSPRALLGWALLLGCADRVGLEDRPCPCLNDAGYICCESIQRCVRPGATCPGAEGGAPPDMRVEDAPVDLLPAPDLPPICQCPEHGPETCGYTGACDERGTCLRYPAGTVCKLASCEDQQHFTPAFLCDGKGTCLSSERISCAPSICRGGSCITACSFNEDCQAPALCMQGTCRAPAFQCTLGDQCGSGFCVEGVCCDRACDSPCETCASPAARGRCLPRPAALAADAGCATDAAGD